MALKDLTSVSAPVPDDLSKILAPDGVKILLKLIYDAYCVLRDAKIVTLLMDENEITEELYVNLLSLWQKRNISLIPISEKQDRTLRSSRRGKAPTIDFCFRSQWDSQSYLGAECKRIEARNKELCDYYIAKGVQRYLDGKYSPKCSEGSMIGYVRETKCSEVAKELKTRINKLPGNPGFIKAELINFEDHYFSQHERIKGLSPFKLHHLLFYFDVS